MGRYSFWIFGVAVLVHFHDSSCIHLKEVKIPSHVLKGSPTRLECRYALDPGETLYSVKWYKDGDEFFRYVPRDEPPVQAFSLLGVDILVENCTENSVSLAPLTLASSGRYRCEVSGEAPLFQTVSDHRDLIVVHLPENDPIMTGIKPRYHINELARLDCTAGPSIPGATLTWFINGEPVNNEALLGPVRDVEDEDGMHTATLSLQFRILERHFVKGDMKLKCSASIENIYSKSFEENVEGERPQRAPAMESRDITAQAAVNSHADRVQAGNTAISRADHTALIAPIISALYFTRFLYVR